MFAPLCCLFGNAVDSLLVFGIWGFVLVVFLLVALGLWLLFLGLYVSFRQLGFFGLFVWLWLCWFLVYVFSLDL